MPAAIDPSMKEALLARLRFYRDLGLTEFYRRPVDPSLIASAVEPTSEILQENEPIPSRKPTPAPPALTTLIKPADKAATLRLIQDDIGECTRCALHTGRHTIVFADGSPNARLMFVGEGPGADDLPVPDRGVETDGVARSRAAMLNATAGLVPGKLATRTCAR